MKIYLVGMGEKKLIATVKIPLEKATLEKIEVENNLKSYFSGLYRVNFSNIEVVFEDGE